LSNEGPSVEDVGLLQNAPKLLDGNIAYEAY
jgi:hypothetical protein